MMAKKRAPQDATLRNVRASRNRDNQLARRMTKLENSVGLLAASVATLAGLMGRSSFITKGKER
jgi:hypothetical protein